MSDFESLEESHRKKQRSAELKKFEPVKHRDMGVERGVLSKRLRKVMLEASGIPVSKKPKSKRKKGKKAKPLRDSAEISAYLKENHDE